MTLFAGIFATGVMLIILGLFSRSSLIDADLVSSLGSLVTRRAEASQTVGLFLHFAAGIVFAGVYALALQHVSESGVPLVAVGAVLGFAHGFLVSFLLIASSSEKHPVPELAETGIPLGTAAAHLVAHAAFGAAVGLSVMMVGYSVPSGKEFVAQYMEERPEEVRKLVVQEEISNSEGRVNLARR